MAPRLCIYRQTWQDGIAHQQMNGQDHFGMNQRVPWLLYEALLKTMLTCIYVIYYILRITAKTMTMLTRL